MRQKHIKEYKTYKTRQDTKKTGGTQKKTNKQTNKTTKQVLTSIIITLMIIHICYKYTTTQKY